MLRPLTVLLLAALVLTPQASAGWFGRGLTITVGEERDGDLLAFATNTESTEGGPVFGERWAYEVEGRTRALDAFGIERETVAYRVDRYEANGTLRSAVRCHRLADGEDTVRTEILGGYEQDGYTNEYGDLLFGSRTTTVNTTTIAHFGGACPRSALQGRTLHEGDRLPLRELLLEWMPEEVQDRASDPATAARFHGRDALEFRFDLVELMRAMGEEIPAGAEGHLRFLVADGLPGVAQVEMWGREPVEGEMRTTTAITGFVAGQGAATPRGVATLPPTNPEARFVAADPLALDDAALGLPFPYAEALTALRNDPQAGFEAWMGAHPDAALSTALYSIDFTVEAFPGVRTTTEGMWMLQFSDGDVQRSYLIERTSGAEASTIPVALPALASPVPIDRVYANDERPADDRAFSPPAFALADSATIARVAERHGIVPGGIGLLVYMPSEGALFLQELSGLVEGDQEGAQLLFDLRAAALLSVGSQTVRTTSSGGLIPLGAVQGGVGVPEKSAFAAALEAPETVAAGAAATAAGVGLLVLLVKVLLVPLYTRLRRDRLLDNPVRARLYERVRGEPGIHRAELVDFAGIGEGATRHHLAQLVKHKLLVELAPEGSGFARYFAAGEVPPEVARREATLRAGSQRAVYELFAREPQLSLREAAARLGMSAPSIHRAKKKLEAAGLLPAAPPTTASVAEA